MGRRAVLSLCVYYDLYASTGSDFLQEGTIISVEGPRFSSKAESKMFRAWGADVINMTTVPEVKANLHECGSACGCRVDLPSLLSRKK